MAPVAWIAPTKTLIGTGGRQAVIGTCSNYFSKQVLFILSKYFCWIFLAV
jgi:hypothetical protein